MALGWLWRAWVPVDAVDAAAFGVAGVALGDMDVHSAWQSWHVVIWTCTLRGRRGTYGTGPGSGGALGSQLTPWAPRLFAWQVWHLATRTFTLRGRCGTYGIWWRATYSHTQLLTHTQLVHTQLVHAQLVHTQLTH